MERNPFAIFNTQADPTYGLRAQQAILGKQIPVTSKEPGMVNLGTWEPQNKPTFAPKPAAPVGTLIGKPVTSGQASAGGGNHAAINPHFYNPDGTPKIRPPKPAAPVGYAIGSNARTPAPATKPPAPATAQQTQQPTPLQQQTQQLRVWNPNLPQQMSFQSGYQQPTPLQQQTQQLRVWNPNLPQQMSFQSGYQQSPYGGQYAPPWAQFNSQPQWGGMSSYYNSMNPWGQMPSPNQMGFNANSAYGQFGNQWQSPFANRQTPNYYGAAQMPVVPNIPTQQPQYVQTPWG